jgi:hypothetical protein
MKTTKLIRTIAILFIVLVSLSTLVFAQDYSVQEDQYESQIKALRNQLHELRGQPEKDEEQIDSIKDLLDKKREELDEFINLQDDSNYNVEVFVPQETITIQSTGPLQDLIDAASDGDTINLDSITYTECVQVSKSLNFVGTGSTIINGGFNLTGNKDYSFSNLEINGACVIKETIATIVYDSKSAIITDNVNSLTLDDVKLATVGSNGGSGCPGSNGAPAYNIKSNSLAALEITDSTLTVTGGSGGNGNSGDDCHGGYGAKAYNLNGVDTNNVEIRDSIFTSNGGNGGTGGPASSSRDGNDGGHGRKGRESYNIYQIGTGLKVYNSEFTSTGGKGGNAGSCNNRDRGGYGGDGSDAYNIYTNANHSIISGNTFNLIGGDAGLATPGCDGKGGSGGDGGAGTSLNYGGVSYFVVDNNIFIAESGDATSGGNSGADGDDCNYGGDGGQVDELIVINGGGTDITVSNNDLTAAMGNAGHGACGDCSGDDDGGDGGDGGDVDDLIGIQSPGLIENNILHDFIQGTAGNGGCADDGSGGDGDDVGDLHGIIGGTQVIGNKIFNFKGGIGGNGAAANSFSDCGSEYGGDGGELDEIHAIEGGILIEGNHIENITQGNPGNGGKGRCSSGDGGHGGDVEEIIGIDVGAATVRNNQIINLIGTKGGHGGDSSDDKTGSGGDGYEVIGIEGGSVVEGNYIHNLKGNDGGCPGQNGDYYGYKQSGEDTIGIDNSGSRNNTITKLTYSKRCTESRGQTSEYFRDGRTNCYDGNAENNYCDEVIGGTYKAWWGANYRRNITAVTPEIKGVEETNNFEIEWYISSHTGDNFELVYEEYQVTNHTIAVVAKADVCSNVRCSYTWNTIMIPEHTYIYVKDAAAPTDFDQSNYAINPLLEDGDNCTLDEECLGSYCIHGICHSERIGVKKPKAYTQDIFTWSYHDYLAGPETVDFADQLRTALADCNATEEENCTIALSFTAESEGILNISNLRVIYEQPECKIDADCEPTYCDSNDGCFAGTYRDYSDVLNTCENEFRCTDNLCTAFTEIITDLDGDGYDIECDNDTFDDDPTIYPGAPELCDGKDNNQDGQIDETFTNLGASCTSGLGECIMPGVFVCAADFSDAVCNATPKPATTEICDDKDNDCDGQIDNDVVEVCGEGVCQGTKSCSYGVWSICSTYQNDAGTCAICDGYGNITYDGTQNNDCDGNDIALIDECGFNPDNVFGTYDYYIGFESTCTGLYTCSQDIGWQEKVSHTCDINDCGAECEVDANCDDSNPSTSNMCDASCACYYYEVIGISGLPDKSIDEEYTPPEKWINLMDYARYDVNDGYGLKFRIVGQTNSALISCHLVNSIYIECESPAQNGHGSTTITVRAYDGDYRAEDSFTITVNSVNDAPILDTVAKTITVNEGDLVKINPNVVDVDGDTLIYTFESPLNSSGEWKTGFGDAGTHYVKLTVSDGTTSASETYEIIVNNVNHAPSLTQIEDYSLYQDQTLTFTLVAEDIDVPYDTLNFTSSEDDVILSKLNDVSAQVMWVPDGNDVGEHIIYFTVTDEEGISDSIAVNVEVLDVNDAPSITGEPPNSQVTLRVNLSKSFKANITDPDDTNLDVKWYYDNEIVAEQVHEFTLTPDELGTKVLSVVAIDKENATTSHSWIINVVDNYQLNTFDGSTTKDILSMDNEQASTVDNFVLEKSAIGKIDFTETLDLTESVDFDSCVTINGNLVAVDSGCLPALSQSSARITLENIPYQQTPNIYYNSGYTLNPSDITQLCTTCTLVSHTPAPTTNGTVVFDVDHFSSFLITYIIEHQPIITASSENTLTSWFDLEIDVDVDRKDYDDVWDGDDFEAEPGDTIEISFKVESLSSDIEFNAEVVLEDVAGKDLDEDIDFDIRDGRSEKEEIEFEIPYNAEEDSYDLEIELDLEDEDGNKYSETIELEVEVERERHSLRILDVSLDEPYLRCDRRGTLEVRMINLGSDDEEITITAENKMLGIDKEKVFTADNNYNDIYRIKIPVSVGVNTPSGNHNIDVRAYYDKDELGDKELFNLLVKPCMEQRTQEQPLQTQSVVQVPNNPLPTTYAVSQTTQVSTEPGTDMHLITLINGFILLLLVVVYMMWYVLFKM